MRKHLPIITAIIIGGVMCAKTERGVIRNYPLDNLDGVIAHSNVSVDREITSDGNGSLRAEASAATTIPLFEISGVDIDNARIFYQARLRTADVIGQVYLEMLCHFPERGEFFSRGQATLLSGTTEWTSQEIPFLLRKGEKPDIIKLNLVINGQGTAWIDDIKLVRGPLN